MIDKNFEEFLKRKLEEEQEEIRVSPLSSDEIRELYHAEYEFKRNLPVLDLKMEPQQIDYNIADSYLPEKWEMPRPGKLLYDDDELINVLKLILFNLGIKSSLDVIPRNLIELYLQEKR